MNPFFNKFYGFKDKNTGPFLAFGEEWFSKYQLILLLLLNLPIIKLWTRWIFRIHKDCKYSEHIVEISPDNYKILVNKENTTLRGDFRTHKKFSKRIYFSFRWWWWILHYIDEIFKPSYMPELNFGFDTLTAYPNTGSTSPGDGYIARIVVTEENITTITSGSGTNTSSSVTGAPAAMLKRGTTLNYYTELFRAVFGFTTNIGTTASISSVVLSLYAYNIASNDIVYVVSSPTSIGTAFFGSFGALSYATSGLADLTPSSYNDFSLNNSGISNITKDGNTFYGVRLENDINQESTHWGYSLEEGGFYVRYADYTGTTADPKLVVEYSTTSISTVSGVSYSQVSTVLGIAKASVKSIIGIE